MTPTEQAALWPSSPPSTNASWSAWADLVTDDFVDHGAPPGLVPPGPDGYITVLSFVTGVLDMRYEIDDVVAVGDLVAVRATGHGVHRSDHLGFPATGRTYTMASMHLFRGEDGRLAEHWGVCGTELSAPSTRSARLGSPAVARAERRLSARRRRPGADPADHDRRAGRHAGRPADRACRAAVPRPTAPNAETSPPGPGARAGARS